MDKDIERCNLCVLPKSNYFNFDDNGTCGLCNTARQTDIVSQYTGGSERLEKNIQNIKERGRRQSFDCVVGLSGGRDSSYLLYILVHKHKLRCLAGYYRTPFTSSTTDANVRRLTSRLNVPLVELGISKELHKRVAKEFTILWREKSHPVISNMACAPCKMVNKEIFKLARMNGIKAIICGANRFESVQIASGVSRNSTLTTNIKAAQRLTLIPQLLRSLILIKKGIEVLSISKKIWRYIPLGIRASIMYIGPHTPFLRFSYPEICALEYFYLSEWNEAEVEKALVELGWELPPGCKSTWKSDCSFAELKNYMFRKMTGMTYLDCLLSNMVRSGVLTRDEALRRVKVEGVVSLERLSEACEILELPDALSTLFLQEA